MAYMTAHPSVFQQNMQSPYPDVDVAGETKTVSIIPLPWLLFLSATRRVPSLLISILISPL